MGGTEGRSWAGSSRVQAAVERDYLVGQVVADQNRDREVGDLVGSAEAADRDLCGKLRGISGQHRGVGDEGGCEGVDGDPVSGEKVSQV